MFMSTFIHVLELTTVLLFMLLAFQVSRCYREYVVESKQAAKAGQGSSKSFQGEALQSTSVLRYRVSLASSAKPEPARPAVQDTAIENFTAVAANQGALPVPEISESAGSEAILNDYIGGFFGEPAVADIQAYKAPASPLAVDVNRAETAELPVLTPLTDGLVSEELAEAEEDIIMVSSDEQSAGGDVEKVMSDKVVHAMLDEAKLACSS